MLSSGEDILIELAQRETEAKHIPDPDVDTYMKVVATRVNNVECDMKSPSLFEKFIHSPLNSFQQHA